MEAKTCADQPFQHGLMCQPKGPRSVQPCRASLLPHAHRAASKYRSAAWSSPDITADSEPF